MPLALFFFKIKNSPLQLVITCWPACWIYVIYHLPNMQPNMVYFSASRHPRDPRLLFSSFPRCFRDAAGGLLQFKAEKLKGVILWPPHDLLLLDKRPPAGLLIECSRKRVKMTVLMSPCVPFIFLLCSDLWHMHRNWLYVATIYNKRNIIKNLGWTDDKILLLPL